MILTNCLIAKVSFTNNELNSAFENFLLSSKAIITIIFLVILRAMACN